jgi:hypothetical protein
MITSQYSPRGIVEYHDDLVPKFIQYVTFDDYGNKATIYSSEFWANGNLANLPQMRIINVDIECTEINIELLNVDNEDHPMYIHIQKEDDYGYYI